MSLEAHAAALVLDRTQRADGRLVETRLSVAPSGLLCLWSTSPVAPLRPLSPSRGDDTDVDVLPRALPPGALAAVFARYAKEVEPDLVRWPPPPGVPCLHFDERERETLVCVVPFVGFGSVHATDWVMMGGKEGAPPVAVPAKLVTAALTRLAEMLERRRDGGAP